MTKTPLAELYETEIEAHRGIGADLLKRWIGALSVGNGVGLFGIFGVAINPSQNHQLYLLLPSAWLFFLGLVLASASTFSLLALNRKQEEYWRLEDVSRILEEARLDADPASAKSAANAESASERWGQMAGYTAVTAALAFLLGVGWPLVHLSYRAWQGTL